MKWNAACTIQIVNQLYVSASFTFYAKKRVRNPIDEVVLKKNYLNQNIC